MRTTGVKRRKKGLREILYGLNADSDKVCIYDIGHIDPAEFCARVRAWSGSEVPQDARDALTVDDVEHTRFRNLSPTEARQYGFDHGVIDTLHGGYPVTAVCL